MRTASTKKTEIGLEEALVPEKILVPSKMTAAVLYGSEDLRIEQIEVPALALDEVLLRVRLALTDGTDLKVWKRGYHAMMIQPPAVFGHEERTDLELLISETKLLNASERTAVYLSFFCDHSLAEIGALLGVTESRACQVRKAALAKLRKAVEQGERSHVFLEAVK